MLYRRDIRNDCRRLWTGRWTEMAPDTEIRPELVTFAIVSPQKHGSWNPHRHIGYELIIPVQGTVYECHVNSRKIKLHSGEALFLEPDDLHIDLLAPGCIFYAFNFQLRGLSGLFPARGIFQKGIPAENRKLRFPPDEVYSLITGIQTHIERAPKTVYYSVDALFAALFWELAAAVPENPVGRTLQQRFEHHPQAVSLRQFEKPVDVVPLVMPANPFVRTPLRPELNMGITDCGKLAQIFFPLFRPGSGETVILGSVRKKIQPHFSFCHFLLPAHSFYRSSVPRLGPHFNPVNTRRTGKDRQPPGRSRLD